MKTIRLLLVAALGTFEPAAARDVESLQPLLLDALRDGHADGVLVGPTAEALGRLFHTTAPLRFDVRRGEAVAVGCHRLEVVASQQGVWDRNSVRTADRAEDRRLVYRVSICEDGRPFEPPAASGKR